MLIILLVSCSTVDNGIDETTKKSEVILNENSIKSKHRESIELFLSSRNVGYVNIDSWETYIEETYNLDINTNIVDYELLSKTIYLDEYNPNTLYYKEYFKEPGVYAIYSSDLAKIINNISDYFLSLNDTKIIDLISSDELESITFLDGNIYVLPIQTMHNELFMRRLYKTNSNFNEQTVPTTINELYEYLIISQKSGYNNVLEGIYERVNPLYPYGDITQSFGIQINSLSDTYFRYDIEVAGFKDMAVTENMYDCVAYIKFLIDQKIINNKLSDSFLSKNTNYDKFINDIDSNEFFSLYRRSDSDENISNSNIVFSTILSNNDTNYKIRTGHNKFYAIQKDTQINDEIIEFLGHAINNSDSINEPINIKSIEYSSHFQEVYDSYINNSVNNRIYDEIPQFYYSNSGKFNETSKYISSINKFEKTNITSVFNKLLYEWLRNDNVNIDEFFDMYIEIAKKENISDYINRINEDIGSVFSFYY